LSTALRRVGLLVGTWAAETEAVMTDVQLVLAIFGAVCVGATFGYVIAGLLANAQALTVAGSLCPLNNPAPTVPMIDSCARSAARR
jgi:hypothetical protein